MRYVVAPVSQFPPGARRVVQAGRRSIGVFRVGDEYLAVRNRCPHQGGPLALGRVYRQILCERPGEMRLGHSAVIACPWHGWHWDMKTGVARVPGDPKARSYAVDVQPADELAPDMARACEIGTEVAETFTVTIEEDYVVVDV